MAFARGALALVALLAPCSTLAQEARSAEERIGEHLQAAQRAEGKKDYLAAAKEYESILEIRPDWALIRQSLGVTLHLAGQYETAISHLREAVRLDSELWGAFLFLGMDLYHTHEFDESIAALKRSAEINPGMLETNRWLGLSHAAAGMHDEAIGYLALVLDDAPDDVEALYSVARSYDSRGDQLFEAIARADPDSPFVYLLQAERFSAEGRSGRARAEYERALAIRPDLAGALEAAPGNPDPATQPRQAGPDFGKVRRTFAASRYHETADQAKGILAENRGSIEAMYWLGRSYKGLGARAVRHMREVNPDSHRVDQLEAELHMERTEFPKAVEAYSRAMRKRPHLPGLRYAVGLAYSRMGRFEDAGKWLEDELARNPHHALARYRLGSVLLESGRGTEAVPHLERAIAANPGLPEIRLDLGRAYLESEDYESAANELETYARSDPGNDRVQFLLATAYRGLGRADDSQRALRRYQELSRERLERVQRDVKEVSEELEAIRR